MLTGIVKKVIGSKNDRELRRIQPLVDRVNQLEPRVQALTAEQMVAKTGEFRERLQRGESLDSILPEAFVLAREAARRTINMRHFDVQIVGGVVLHEGKIAEMKTGEGKTLVATLAVYLNSLLGKGVHVVTVNDYLARRDSEWMGPVYRYLGLAVGVIQHQMGDLERQQAYRCDVTYGTNNEFGFDYLRDNMKFALDHCVQRELHYAIVDEVDSILVDEARTPLIISGPAEESTDKYDKIDRTIPRLRAGRDYQVDEKYRAVTLTEEGVTKSEGLLGIENLYDLSNIDTLHHINQALKAHTLFKRDVDYVVKDGEVIIVDEFTGRLMPGRRYSDGLHQALEAKEKVSVANENQTLATITFQNYFRMYEKLAGMTGTADTEAAEFHKIYALDVVVIPTNKPLIRTTYPDVVYRTEEEKFRAAVEEIVELHEMGRPVLVGTISIEKSEHLSSMLRKRGIDHHVLNAKHHEKEAEIIAQAGQRGAVTIATNMAGRGTDIILGGEVAALAGLHILGTERHESRRIDNQLRGRAGRQGDPGSSRFYLSLEDDLLRIFGSDRISGIMEKLGMEDGQPIENRLVTRAIENAQGRVEAHNFEIRKQLLEYDDVLNKQREVIYAQRRQILEGRETKEMFLDMVGDVLDGVIEQFLGRDRHPQDWDLEGLAEALQRQFSLEARLEGSENLMLAGRSSKPLAEFTPEEIRDFLWAAILSHHEARGEEYGPELMCYLERRFMLEVLDNLWKDHLLSMDYLKEGIGLRGYAQ
ncbi:MAG: preprotein translocase subunit SecA, partial [Candidatus Tectomicrobia bacterium]|nr:preprotein translocase subunit SecA [Candidatus Tectomicrobia bacterium]